MASMRVEVGLELGILPDGAGRLLEDTLAFSITDDVVGLARDGLSCVSMARKRKVGEPTRAAPVKRLASKSPSVIVRNSPMPNACLYSSQ